MDAVFLKLVNMSITASWLVLAVIILRLLIRNAPKTFSCLLWVLVAVRLVCPFSFESVFSLVPSVSTVPAEIVYAREPAIDSGVTVVNNIVNPVLTKSFAPSTELTSVNPIQIWLALASCVWVLGIAVMLIYTLVSYIKLRRKTSASIEIDKGVYICDGIDTPFILGLFRPRIILPSAMNEENFEYVIAHEKAHLRRLDHIWKPLGFGLLAVYWFNPVMWAAYILFCRDIELACDERVIKDMNAEDKAAYSSALLSCSIPRKAISACPLAFGEVGVKQRIKSVLNYKKPTFWIVVAAIVTIVAVAVCFLTDPKSEDKSKNDLASWIGVYEYEEFWDNDVNDTVSAINYQIEVYSKGDETYARFAAMGFQTDIDTVLTASGDENKIELREVSDGTLFLTLYKEDGVVKTQWDKISPAVENSDGIYFVPASNEDITIVGTWEAPMTVLGIDVGSIEPMKYYTFNADGTGVESTNVNYITDREFVYSIENDIVTLTYSSETGAADDDFVQFRYSIDAGVLTLGDIVTDRAAVLTRGAE